MTPNAKWSMAVRDRDGDKCQAKKHDPRCHGIGEHAHHLNFKAQIPTFCYWIVDNGIWLSGLCHGLAHKTHNGNITKARLDRATQAVNARIRAVEPNKPELLLGAA